ncbi:MAG: zonular occludens toxin domain-containing protein [Caldisericum exile]|uniref:zonular occludens toxin domain-containing protein n=1 Tax=Caldisericum exile TaxID=693075 RepID=UPI003C767C15
MIYLYSGTPGTGKSYHSLLTALRWINRKKIVIANFPIKTDRENFIYKEVIDVKDLLEISMKYGLYKKESSALLIVDEAGIIYNSRDFMQNMKRRNDWIKFYSQHRKFGYDVVLVAQDDRMIDRQIRNMIEVEIKHLTILNEILSLLPIKITVTKWYQFKNMRGSVGFIVLLNKYFKMYDTMRMFDIDIDKLKKELLDYKIIDSESAKRLIANS